MQKKLLDALASHYQAKLQKAEATLLVYLSNPSGIGEHPQVVDELVKQVDDIAHAKLALGTLGDMVQVDTEGTDQPAAE
tara:strand:+ start:13996 stop:14232 length:237 start_codon:yes stop_codon:yes gene_type:complete